MVPLDGTHHHVVVRIPQSHGLPATDLEQEIHFAVHVIGRHRVPRGDEDVARVPVDAMLEGFSGDGDLAQQPFDHRPVLGIVLGIVDRDVSLVLLQVIDRIVQHEILAVAQ